uniref:Uncharacterized protein n=1 Tax=Cereibacter sphaeroides (strain ATCC 17025 / ATH 2.4.3) TaxID=349102 RepID=A4WVR0_CERS5
MSCPPWPPIRFDEAMIGDSMRSSWAPRPTPPSSTAAGPPSRPSRTNLTLMRAISEHDFALAHDEAFAGFNASGWTL